MHDSDAFEGYLRDHFPWHISVEYQGNLWPLERVFYKLLRCQLVHEAGFVADVQFLDDVGPEELIVRAGGNPDHILRFSPGWFHKLASIASDAR